MVIAQISHGLGNQLFQYAAARRLAVHRRTELKLDLQSYTDNPYRRYGLGYFNINAAVAGWREVAALCPAEGLERALRRWLPGRFSPRAIRTWQRVRGTSPYRHRTVDYTPDGPLPGLLLGRVVSERFYHFDAAVLECPDNVALCGYWQSEKYFQDIAPLIRQELALKAPLTGQNLAVARQIQSTNSVSLHIRRGDKVREAHSFVTTGKFCARVLAYFRGKLGNPRFFVFSDEWAWVRTHLAGEPDVVFVDHNGDEHCHEDLRLMSLCKNNVLAPSSFSWWAAWLNSHADKVVVRPPAWINLGNHDSKDVFPPGWITLA